MTLNDGFDRTVSEWLDEQAGRGAPGYLDEVLARTTRTRQRPAWSSLERGLPVAITFRARVAPMSRPFLALALIAVLALAAALLVLAGVGQRRLPARAARPGGQSPAPRALLPGLVSRRPVGLVLRAGSQRLRRAIRRPS